MAKDQKSTKVAIDPAGSGHPSRNNRQCRGQAFGQAQTAGRLRTGGNGGR